PDGDERLVGELRLDGLHDPRGRLARGVRDHVHLDDGGWFHVHFDSFTVVGELERYEGPATIEKVAALSRRRGFVFPSSDIYGGVGSSYDYGHYGVLLKQNVKQEWQRSMVQEREDIVLLDSAIILHPKVWVASGHVGGFSDPLVDCRTCKLRFRADHLAVAQCGRKPSKHPGGTPDCDLTEARQFNLMFETSIGPVRDEGSQAF